MNIIKMDAAILCPYTSSDMDGTGFVFADYAARIPRGWMIEAFGAIYPHFPNGGVFGLAPDASSTAEYLKRAQAAAQTAKREAKTFPNAPSVVSTIKYLMEPSISLGGQLGRVMAAYKCYENERVLELLRGRIQCLTWQRDNPPKWWGAY